MKDRFHFETTYEKNPKEIWAIWLRRSMIKGWLIALYLIALLSSLYVILFGSGWAYYAGIFCLGLLIIYPMMTILLMYRVYKNDPTMKYPTNLTINEVGVNLQTPIREINHGWEYFTHWENLRGNILLVDDRSKQYVIIPEKAFPSTQKSALIDSIRKILPCRN